MQLMAHAQYKVNNQPRPPLVTPKMALEKDASLARIDLHIVEQVYKQQMRL